MDAALSAFALVFVAELGDKSMLLAAALTARYRPWPVFGGVAAAALLMLGLSSAIGAALGAALPEQALMIGGGVLFIGFGVWTLRRDDDEQEAATEVSGKSILLGVMVMFLVAELGDKSMIATAALAGNQPPIPTWLGAATGMTLACGVMIAVTAVVGRKIPRHVLRYVAAAMFVGFGAFMIYGAASG